jgi:hypothetical protein
MKVESNKKENENAKKGDTFIYAAILFGSLILGTIIVLLKLFGLF